MVDLIATAEFVRSGRVGGAEQALAAALRALSGALGESDRLSVVDGWRIGMEEASIPPPVALSGPRFLQESVTFAATSGTYDAYYFPNYFTPPCPSSTRVVTTIHDQQFRHIPENFSIQKRAWLRVALRTTVRRADALIVLSEYVLDDLEKVYGERFREKAVVVPNAIDFSTFGTGDGRVSDRPYVLTVASQYRHKNLATLVRAMQSVQKEMPDVKLVMVGQLARNLIGTRGGGDVEALAGELLRTEDYLITGYVRRDLLGSLYRHAHVFAFPSLYEGFGLPPVEALGFGVPVITTRAAAIPEITLGMAEYVDDPLDPHELAGRILDQLRRDRRPTRADVQRIRRTYAPSRIGRQLYDVMAGA